MGRIHIPLITWLRIRRWPRGRPAVPRRPCRRPRRSSPLSPRGHAINARLGKMTSVVVVGSAVLLALAPAAGAHTRYYAGWGPNRWCYPRNTFWLCQRRSVTATIFAAPGPFQSGDQPEGVVSLTAWVRRGNGFSIGAYPYRLAATDPWQAPRCMTYVPTGNTTAELALNSGLSASTFDCGAASAGHFWHWATLSGTRHYVLEDWYQIQLTRTDTTPYGQSSSIGWTGTYCLRIASDATGKWWYGVFDTGCYDPLIRNA
jgi:hypothetical protein